MYVEEVEAEPGFFVCETVMHSGWAMEYGPVRTLNITCANTGWTFTVTVQTESGESFVAALDAAQAAVPVEFISLHVVGSGKSLDRRIVDWAAKRNVLLSRRLPSGPGRRSLHSNRHQLAHHQGSHLRYDLDAINRLWSLFDDRLNFLTPIAVPIGYRKCGDGRRKRLYDSPATPFDRLVAAGTLSPRQHTELLAHRDRLDPHTIATEVFHHQSTLGLRHQQAPQDFLPHAMRTVLIDPSSSE